VPYPILLVAGGLALGLVPGLPDLELPPDLVLVGRAAASAAAETLHYREHRGRISGGEAPEG
jgi:hypothetical protein